MRIFLWLTNACCKMLLQADLLCSGNITFLNEWEQCLSLIRMTLATHWISTSRLWHFQWSWWFGSQEKHEWSFWVYYYVRYTCSTAVFAVVTVMSGAGAGLCRTLLATVDVCSTVWLRLLPRMESSWNWRLHVGSHLQNSLTVLRYDGPRNPITSKWAQSDRMSEWWTCNERYLRLPHSTWPISVADANPFCHGCSELETTQHT